ncbi:uncharacterized protein LOC129740913 [Uranotaenia lowii]|uniref:uncharacterized protein LOC129740913 n=1 Tax=Uranotaenia lowii TaxID=190385 RepID=UPI00247AFCE7|nr:uncharacterized protein LOC129740913 [Uranotaenia lowii]
MFKLSVICLCGLLLVASQVATTAFRECPNKAATPEEFSIEGCESSPCSLKPGSALVAHAFRIKSTVSTNNVQAYVRVQLAPGLEIDYELSAEQQNACAGSIRDCPLEQGKLFDYTFAEPNLKVPQVTLPIVVVRAGIRDGTTEIACVEFDAQLVAGAFTVV